MIKAAVKRMLISHLNAKSTSLFRQRPNDASIEDAAYRALHKVQVSHASSEDQADAFWTSSQAAALNELTQPGALRNFLRLPTIQRTMYESYAPFLIREYLAVVKQVPRNSGILTEDSVGNPVPFLLDASTSGNLIHHLFHVLKFRHFAATDLSNLSEVVEFGGGYGSLCRVFFRLGFGGRYIIQDLPTFSVLQTYFLRMTGHDAMHIPVFSGNAGPAIVCTNNLSIASEDNAPRLYVATWSLSEVGSSLRLAQERVMRNCRYFLIAYRDSFEGFDNTAYFKRYCVQRADILWEDKAIPHIAHSRYLFGRPRQNA